MEVIHSPEVARDFVLGKRAEGRTVGLVPTMGALHEGHLSLVRISEASCDLTVVSVFVNPAQFGPDEDLSQYPRTLERDCDLLRAERVAAVFVPSADSMYPPGFSTTVCPPEVAASLEGRCRPDHFGGVATVVLKLFQCLPCQRAVFGRKDYQQLKVVEAMSRDLNLGIEIIAGEIVREMDGLAMSSRNRYLDNDQRHRALRIHQALQAAASAVESGEVDTAAIESAMRRVLLGLGETASETGGVDKIDYAVVVDAESLSPLTRLDRPSVALIAAHVGATRLIDNRVIVPKEH